MKSWKGNNLEGVWDITLKIDGVQAVYLHRDLLPRSRKDKALYNLPSGIDLGLADDGEYTYEVYLGDFKKSIQATRTKNTAIHVSKESLYQLEPNLDSRLYVVTVDNPTADTINNYFKDALNKGYEGLVLREKYVIDGEVLKVKPFETHDITVIGITEGTGRDKGTLACFITPMGKVPVKRKTDKIKYFTDEIIGETIEVKCMQLTKDGKFRHPRFVRIRYDK